MSAAARRLSAGSDSTLAAVIFINPAYHCVSVPAPVWGLSNRVCRRPLRHRLPVPAGCTKSSMTASAFSRGVIQGAYG